MQPINLLDPHDVNTALRVYCDDLYWMRIVRQAAHAMKEHRIISEEEAYDLQLKARREEARIYNRMRIKPGAGVLAIGTVHR